MDNGEVIPGLDEDWNFMGANLMEWASGFMAIILMTEAVHKVARSMPLLLAVGVATTVTLAALRKSFPDQERGLRNRFMAFLGLVPVGLPPHSAVQPMWSGAPMRQLPKEAHFNFLGLEEALKCELGQLDPLGNPIEPIVSKGKGKETSKGKEQ